MEVRRASSDEDAVIASVHRQAFGDHGEVVTALLAELRASPGDSLSLVAISDGSVAGHAMFSPAFVDAHAWLVEVRTLSPLGVPPQYQGRGAGTALITYGLAMLEEQGIPAVFVEGDPHYYHRHGFVPGGPLGFRKPSLRIPDAAFQVRLLRAYEPWMTGTFVYPDVFWRHDAVGLRER